MSLFSLALSDALETCRLSQTELAATTGIAFPQLNRYTTGRSDPRPPILLKLLQAFPEPEAAKLLSAYLLDQCPREFRSLVEVRPRTDRLGETAPDALNYLPSTVREAFNYLASKSTEPHVLDFILHMTRLLRGEQPDAGAAALVDQIAADERARRAQATRDSQAKNA